MRITITAMLAIGLLGLSFHATAVTAIPDRGLTQDAIRAQFGAPKRQVAPVGNPPISRWIYDDFTVYFEGNFSIHAVSHARTLTTPPAVQAAPAPSTPAPAPAAVGTVDALPEIDELDATETSVETAAETTTAAEAPATEESSFRFDPTTGRIIEVGADGKAVRSPTAQPVAAEPRETPEPVKSKIAPVPAPVSAPAPAPAPAPAATPAPAAVAPTAPAAPAATGTSFRFDPVSGRMVEVDSAGNIIPADAPKAAEPAPVAPPPEPKPQQAPAPASATPAAPAQPSATEAPATEPASQFRFDPVTGRIVMQEPEQKTEQAPSQPAQPAAPPAATEKAPAQAPASAGEDDGGFRLQW